MAEASDSPGGPWRTHDVPSGEELEIRVGPLGIRVREHAGEVHLSHRLEGEPAPADRGEWARFAPASWNRSLTLRPAFPDRTVIVAPDDPFRLLEGAEARVYVRLPLVAVVEVEGRAAPATLARIPTYRYSDTWWGVHTEGELCYWLPTHARREMRPELFEDHLAVCPLQLMNRSESDLDVEKIAFRATFLSLYRKGRRLWSDETRVRYRGEAEGSSLDMAGGPPGEEPDAELVLPPRERMARGFRSRTFARIRSLHPWT
ncbi:MAG: DUF432 domain-containing protein [Gemmatimonadetes bacterium]|nr:DUF432 domain-containing protein [Gemmatimonadota bacterium]